MNAFLEDFFKKTPLGINSVMKAAVSLAEQVNSKDISGKEKTELVVSSLVSFLGNGNPELVALVEGIVPGMLHLVISTARGEFKLSAVRNCSCFPAVRGSSASVAAPAPASAPAVEPAVAVADPTPAPPAGSELNVSVSNCCFPAASVPAVEVAVAVARPAERWAWTWLRRASNPAVTVRTPI